MEQPGGVQRLQQGEMMRNGQHVTGLVLLVQAISLRYARLEIELTTRAMHDIMNFRRNRGKTIDLLLRRFYMIRQ